jgi:hypothetical protein
MRFFSNDARESTDEQASEDRPDRVQSDPVAVPAQRPPSPWSNTPATADDTTRDATTRDDTSATDDADRPPSPEPTALGGSTADSAAGNTYASSTAGKRDGHDGDGTADGYDHGGAADDVDLPLDDKSTPTDSGRASTESGALKDDGGFDDPKAVDPATDRPLDTDGSPSDVSPSDGSRSDVSPSDRSQSDSSPSDSSPSDRSPSDSFPSDDDRRDGTGENTATEAATLKDDGGFDDPKAVDPATDTPLTTDDGKAEAAPAADTVPAIAPVPVPVPVAADTTATAAKADTLFAADDAQSFQDRWREVQLRFVDSPKDAAGDAAKLVDEAVEKLTASLKSQRDGLANDTDDTEQLRVQLRGYREILIRIIGL